MTKKSIFGLSENLVAALSYVFSPITAFVVLVLERDNKYVRFHAMQSFIYFLALGVISFILGFIPLLGHLLSGILGMVWTISMIFLFINAFTGKEFKIPMLGDICRKQVGK